MVFSNFLAISSQFFDEQWFPVLCYPTKEENILLGNSNRGELRERMKFNLRCKGILPCFSTFFSKGNNFCDLLVAPVDKIQNNPKLDPTAANSFLVKSLLP